MRTETAASQSERGSAEEAASDSEAVLCSEHGGKEQICSHQRTSACRGREIDGSVTVTQSMRFLTMQTNQSRILFYHLLTINVSNQTSVAGTVQGSEMLQKYQISKKITINPKLKGHPCADPSRHGLH